MVISPGEIEAGIFVTVLKWEPEDPNQVEFGLFGSYQTCKRRDFLGHVLKVKAINLPFVLVDDLGIKSSNIVLDLRDVKLMELKEEYVKAILQVKPEEDKDISIPTDLVYKKKQ